MKRAFRTIACFAFVLCFTALLPQLDPVARGGLLLLLLVSAWGAERLARWISGGSWVARDAWIDIFAYCVVWYCLVTWSDSGPFLAYAFVAIAFFLAGWFLVLWLMDRADVRRAIREGMGPKNSLTTQTRPRFEDD